MSFIPDDIDPMAKAKEWIEAVTRPGASPQPSEADFKNQELLATAQAAEASKKAKRTALLIGGGVLGLAALGWLWSRR